MFQTQLIKSLFRKFKRKVFAGAALCFILAFAYESFWGRYLYRVTAYCGCPICINVKEYQDGQFASGKPVYWGGAAADRRISFNSKIELLPHWPQDLFVVHRFLDGRRRFVVEDRGGKIKGRAIDLFIPDELGGHEMALEWGVRRMRVKVDGKLAV